MNLRRQKIKGGVRIFAVILTALLVGGLFSGIRARFFRNALPSSSSILPPTQPLSGPGGSDYSHSKIKSGEFGSGDFKYWLFEPDEPKLNSAPLIVFNHGWGATNPEFYGAWIEHIVKKGNIVAFPSYQSSLRTPTDSFTPNAISAIKSAISELQKGDHARPMLDKFAILGHSVGGILSVNIAALSEASFLPIPKAVMSVQPAKTWAKIDKLNIRLSDLSAISGKTLLLVVAGDKDRVARDIDAKKIFKETSQIPLSQKNFITIVSDSYGKPELLANHGSPAARGSSFSSSNPEKSGRFKRILSFIKRIRERNIAGGGDYEELEYSESTVNALDYYGYWKLFDGLYEAAFYGKNRDYALGKTDSQKFMGLWSDGRPVNELVVSDNP